MTLDADSIMPASERDIEIADSTEPRDSSNPFLGDSIPPSRPSLVTWPPRTSVAPTFTALTDEPIRLGRYEIIGELAKGGMGTVYLCRYTAGADFRRLCALKLVHEHLTSDETIIDMLLDEARIASRIHHANVVPIIDLGSQGSRHYVVMDYVEGCSLAQLCRRHRNKRPPRLLLPLIVDMLQGLHAAHTLVDDDEKPLHLVHRDVSPQNVLVGVDGVARVIDFGIAKAVARRTNTDDGRVKGKIAYMSPEQILEEPLDARSDIFAAGVLLWTSLTGKRLFQGNNEGATIRNLMGMPVPRPSAVGLRPHKSFDAICLRALMRDPDKRYQSAEEMAAALRKLGDKHGLAAPRTDIQRWIKRTFEKEFAARREAIRDVQARSQSVSLDDAANAMELPSLTEETIGLSAGGKKELIEEAVRADLRAPPGRTLKAAVGGAAAVLVIGGAVWLTRGDEPVETAEKTDEGIEHAEPAQTTVAPAPATAAPSATESAAPSASASAPPAPSFKPSGQWPSPAKVKPAPGGRDVGY